MPGDEPRQRRISSGSEIRIQNTEYRDQKHGFRRARFRSPSSVFRIPFFVGLVVLAEEFHPIPFRTRPLKPPAPMVLRVNTRESRSPPGQPRTDETIPPSHQNESPVRFPRAGLSFQQIAAKLGLTPLTILYDYLYRLTSGGVHFNVQSLLRSGWGESSKNFQFSTKNFHPYFSAYCTTYGAFMFCLYFEFFGSILRPDSQALVAVAEIKKNLLFTPRWPEMVTFEEMNLKAPDEGRIVQIIMSALQAVTRKRLVSSSANYTQKASAERRLVSAAFKRIAAATTKKTAGGNA
jgi:hypothetical protein